MYEIKKTFEIAAAHSLLLDYDSKCKNLHGHNWIITITLKSETLDKNGMIMDFSHIKAKIINKLDHAVLNDVLDFNPTAENIAKYIFDSFTPLASRVDVTESESNTASYYEV